MFEWTLWTLEPQRLCWQAEAIAVAASLESRFLLDFDSSPTLHKPAELS